MPKQSQATVARSETDSSSALLPHSDDAETTLEETAHSLFRTAKECCRQHQRYAALIQGGAPDHELDDAFDVVTLCDEQLARASAAYEIAGSRMGAPANREWWQTANILWLASREYVLHHQEDDGGARDVDEGSFDKLTQLSVQADLAASALLALRHALENYKKICPDAQLAH
jgi:hypothetical protein